MMFEPTLDEQIAGAEEAALFMRSLANESRMLILCNLIDRGEMSVGELESELGFRQSKLSQHLALLRGERLVATRREGKSIYYRVVSSEVEKTLELMYSMFCSQEAVDRRRVEKQRHRAA